MFFQQFLYSVAIYDEEVDATQSQKAFFLVCQG